MSQVMVASRYAKSLFDLSIELKILDRIYKDMILLEQVCSENRPLVTLLRNPIIRFDYKLRSLNKIFEKHVHTLTLKFFNLISRKNRASILPEVSKRFVNLYLEYKGIVKADVTTAVSLSPALRKEFESIIGKATGKKVELNTSVDESLVGGYVLKIGDNQLDDSIKNKLKNLRRELTSR